MKKYIFILSLILTISINKSNAQVAVISEYYNQSGTPVGEWTEIIITADNANLVGYTLRDNSESGDWQGGVKFKDIPLWQNLRKGTILVIWHRSTGAPKDINPSDGYLEVNAEDTDLFDKRLFSAASWDIPVLNISQNNDIIQLIDASDNNVHSLGHSSTGETASMSSITGPKIFHNGSIEGGGYGIRVVPGRNLDEYNKGWDASNSYTEESNNTSKGLPNNNATYKNANQLFWQSLREPEWNSNNSGVSITLIGDKAQINWMPANSTMNAIEGYLILRVPSDEIATFPPPADGKIYNVGDMLGSAKVVGLIYYLNQNQFIDNDLINAECGRQYIYRIYAFRFNKDDENMDGVPENVRGRTYNGTQFAQTNPIDKPKPPKPTIQSKEGRNVFCESEAVFIDLIGDYTTDIIFQWYLDGKPIPGETGSHLNVTKSGNYQIIAQNLTSLCETSSEIAKITILPEPTASLFIRDGSNFIPVINDTIIYVCKENGWIYPILNLQGSDSTEWYFDNRLKTEELNKSETVADQKGTYYGVVLNGICRDTTPSVTILYYNVQFEFDKTELSFLANSKLKDTLQITNKSNAGIILNLSDLILPNGINVSNVSFPLIIKKDSSIKLEFTFATLDTSYFYRLENIYIQAVCNRSFKISAAMVRPQPHTAKIVSTPDTLDFGIFPSCDFDAKNIQKVILKSIGNLSVKVLSIEFPDSYLKFNNITTPFIIDSNASISIDFEILDPTPKVFSGKIIIHYESIEANPIQDTAIVYYKGEIVRPDLIFDNNLDFSIPTCSDTSYITINATNPTNLELEIATQPDNSQLFIENLPIIFAPKETKNVRFRLIANSSINFSDKITIEPCSIEKTLAIVGNKTNVTLQASPILIDFGYVAACNDSSNIRKLSLIIRGGEVSIKNIDISNDFEINANIGDVFLGDTTLKIKYIGTNTGPTSGKLKLTFSPCDMIIEIDLKAIGVQPEISITPNNILDFGDVPASIPSTKSITVKNISNLPVSINFNVNNAHFILDPSIQLPISLQPNEQKDISFNYLNPNTNEYDTLLLNIALQPCGIQIPYKAIAHSIENNISGLIKIDLPEIITGKPGDWVNIPIRFLSNDLSFKDANIHGLQIDFEYNGKILYCKEITGLNTALDNIAKIRAFESNINTFSVAIDSIPPQNSSGNDWLNFSIIAQILQGDTLQDLFRVKGAQFKASANIQVESDTSSVIVVGDCLIANRQVTVGLPSNAETVLLPDYIIHSKIHLAVNSDLSLEIYNINGVKVKQKNYSSMKYGSYDVYINISDLTDGVYFIKISNLDMLNTEKFILIK